MAWWYAIVIATRDREFDSRPFQSIGSDIGHVVHIQHTCVSVTKQHNLVSVVGQRYFAGGKVIVGLASHGPCITDFSGFPPTGSRPM